MIKVNKVSKSKIDNVNFDALVFGKIFTDHMYICHFKNGSWLDPEIKPYQPIKIEPSASVFHYGQAVFEGMKAYKDNYGKVWLFRPDENFNRINRSSHRLQIPEFPEEYFFEGLNELVKLDKDWVKPGYENSLYIRPFVFASEYTAQATASSEYIFMIICTPVKSYYNGENINVLVSEKFSRAANGGVGYVKAAGNYAAQFYPISEAAKKGFQQIIWTDANHHEYMEEAGTMNIFFVINEVLVTSPTNDRILDGVTRKSIITLAKKRGLRVEERPIKITEVIDAHKKNKLTEVFGTGTAVVVLPISSLSYKEISYKLPKETKLANELKRELLGIQYNSINDEYVWTRKID